MSAWTRNIFFLVITRLFMAYFVTMQIHFSFILSHNGFSEAVKVCFREIKLVVIYRMD